MPEHLRLLLAYAYHVALFSLFAVGGGVSTLIPQMHAQFVVEYHWLSERSFAELLAVSQAAPGPNFLLIPLIGYRIASWAGAVVGMLAFLVLPVTITLFVGRLLHQRENAWIARLRRAFRPVTAGLWIASGTVVAIATDHARTPVIITVLVALISLVIDISPLWWCLAAGIIGYILV
jgi:chromate transporter